LAAELGRGYRSILRDQRVEDAGGTEYLVRQILADWRARQQAA
jgi:hypothetical protein